MMRKLNIFFSLAPAPTFLLGFIYSVWSQDHMHHANWEMPAMWLIMCFAHLSPWLMWYQQKKYQKVKVFPDKQQ
jgi:hypothetical protein